MAQWETGRAGQLTPNLSRIAGVLGVGVEFLMLGEDKRAAAEAVTGDELAMLRLYRECAPEDRRDPAAHRAAAGRGRDLTGLNARGRGAAGCVGTQQRTGMPNFGARRCYRPAACQTLRNPIFVPSSTTQVSGPPNTAPVSIAIRFARTTGAFTGVCPWTTTTPND